MDQNIPFNYFYIIFKTNYKKEWLETQKQRISENNKQTGITIGVTKAQQLSIYNKLLLEICSDYVSLSNAPIDIFPSDVFEFVNLVLETMHENPYKESFLESLQFIYQDYLECLEKGFPLLFSSETEEEISYMEVTLDSAYHIMQFDSINMDVFEQDKIMNKFVAMESKNQIGPHEKVRIHVRKDI